MKERPILFSGPMVRAILDGRKTQTRRPVKFCWTGTDMDPMHRCPLGQPGDRLWVRETWRRRHGAPVEYQATTSASMEYIAPWRPSIHMPRWASRITLEIARVWVERVQDITEDGAIREGMVRVDRCSPFQMFRDTWESIYGTWDANPFVWAVEFRRTK